MADSHNFRYADSKRLKEYAVDSATVIEVGDLLWLDTDDVKPASAQSDQLTEAKNQDLFCSKFAGVAMQKSASGSTTPIRVATTGIFEFDSPSATYQVGDIVAPDEAGSGTALLNKTVVAGSGVNGIGKVVKAGASITRVLVEVDAKTRFMGMHDKFSHLGVTREKFISIFDFRKTTGIAIDATVTEEPHYTASANVEIMTWAADDVAAAKTYVQIPDDYDAITGTMNLKLWALQTGSTNVITIALNAYQIRNGVVVGADISADDYALSQSGVADTPEELSIALTTTGLAKGDVLYIHLTPSAHGTDSIFVYGMMLEYSAEE
jgi:hypothetical protein